MNGLEYLLLLSVLAASPLARPNVLIIMTTIRMHSGTVRPFPSIRL